MRLIRLASLATVALSASMAVAAFADNAPAATNQPAPGSPVPATGDAVKIAVFDPQVVLDNMKEMKAIKTHFEQKQTEVAAEESSRKAEIDQLKESRSNIKPGSQQYNDMSASIDQKAADFQSFEYLTRAKAEREQKHTIQALDKKIQDACAKVSQQEGLDLVIATMDQPVPSTENMTVEQVRNMLDNRVVMYHSARIDITQKVIIQVNLDYDTMQKNGGAAPAADTGGTPAGDGGMAPPVPPPSGH